MATYEDTLEFTTFVDDAEPRLRQALSSMRGPSDGWDATAEAFAWAWENWDEVRAMANPIGYLYRVGVSRSRRRRHLPLNPSHLSAGTSAGYAFEPGLGPALARLPRRQRECILLVHGCGWSLAEVADALRLSKSSVATHVERALTRLRKDLGNG